MSYSLEPFRVPVSSTTSKLDLRPLRNHVLLLASPEDLRTKNHETRAQMRLLAKELMPDGQMCVVPGHQSALAERVPLYSLDHYQTSCGLCLLQPPAGGVLPYTLAADTLAELSRTGIVQMNAIRDRWVRAAEAVRNSHNLGLQQATVNALERTTTLEGAAPLNAALLIEERSAWLQYTVLVFDVVRENVAKPAKARGPNHAKYVQFLQDYKVHIQKRNPTSTGVPRMWCIVHHEVGHLLPTLGGANCIDEYKPCLMCPVREIVTAKTTRREASAAAASSSSSSAMSD